MIKVVDSHHGASAWFETYTEVSPQVESLPKFRIGPCFGPDAAVRSFLAKHYNYGLIGYRPLIVGEVRDVFVNNIGNFVRLDELNGEECQLADLDQQNEKYLGNAEPAFSSNRETIYFDCACVLMRPGDHIYGHWLVDILPRVFLLLTTAAGQRCKFLLKVGTPNFAVEMLRIAGIDDDRIAFVDPAACNVRVGIGLYASSMRSNQIVHPRITEFAGWLAERIVQRGLLRLADIPQYDGNPRIMISRQHLKRPYRFCNNAFELQKRLVEEFGFYSFSPERHSLAEQLMVFSRAKYLVGEEGSGMHNSIFCPSDACVITLRGPRNRGLVQSSLCRAKEQTIVAIFGRSEEEGQDMRWSNYVIDMKDVEETMLTVAPATSGQWVRSLPVHARWLIKQSVASMRRAKQGLPLRGTAVSRAFAPRALPGTGCWNNDRRTPSGTAE